MNKLVLFEQKEIRRVWHDEQCFFAIPDVYGVLTDSKDEKAYWRQLKKRDKEIVTFCHDLKVVSKSDGKKYLYIRDISLDAFK